MPAYTPLPIDALQWLATVDGPVVLLDTARPDPSNRFSYLFLSPCRELQTSSPGALPDLLHELQRESQNRWVAGFLSYEAGYALEPRLHDHMPPQRGRIPLLWFGVYERPYRFDHLRGTWDRPLPVRAQAQPRLPTAPGSLSACLGRREYGRALAQIKRYIAQGDTYQVNFTFDTRLSFPGTPWKLYRDLRSAQPVPYASYVRTPAATVLSLSPELFFSRQHRTITTRPMKGTAARGRTTAEDERAARELALDAKNRAENVMIVDLLRNDIGRVCRTGSVRVERLFSVETHPSIHQMTSTVSGTLSRNHGLADILRALFPCGSVTGAPKIRTMEIIRELELQTRGVYCGAIGYSCAESAVFSVPIRTLQRTGRRGPWSLRVGSGVVWDSDTTQEWEECLAKVSFADDPAIRFEVVETMLWDDGYRYLRDHARRMMSTARAMGVPCTLTRLRAYAEQVMRNGTGMHLVRMLLSRDGCLRTESRPVTPTDTSNPQPVLLSSTPVDRHQPLLYHKTTHRPWYDSGMRALREGRCFDVLYTNEEGHVTEGARSTLFADLGSGLVTPPIADGLLPGVLRARMLRRGACRERSLTVADLRKARELYCGNSVRGLVPVRLAGTLR